MAGVCLLAVIAALLCGLAARVTEKKTGAVFVSQHAAHTMLLRQRRHNTGRLEEVMKDNLERECKEEVCNFEEAREVFENEEKTMEFWAVYFDGDQCQPPPCQNDGECVDGIGSYVCWCKPNFGGKNCEIELAKQCSVDNGGCSHFCVMQGQRPECQCAAGYNLGSDKRSCEPTGQFSCGHVESKTSSRSFLSPRTGNNSNSRDNTSFNLSDQLTWDYDDDNMTQFYDYYDSFVNDSASSEIPSASSAETRVRSLNSSFSVAPDDNQTNSSASEDFSNFLSWAFFPTLPTITEQKNTDKRIVGGNEAPPGGIPWQVTLMSHSPSLGRVQSFCGGSLLSELWVITAAHCLVTKEVLTQGYFVRVGEHDVDTEEGPERDHLVAEQHIHPKYNYTQSPYNHDIALLKLSNAVELSHQRRPICLGPKDFTESILRDSSSSQVSGWGLLASRGRSATKLQRLEVPYVERTKCKQSSRYQITRFMFCAGFENEQKDSCHGDSGGPHATNFKGTWFLTGIVSWGEDCAKDGKYGIYTRVSRYYSWISQRTGLQI
ncbi:coagulation factor IXb [Cynoglossus semilaevis]|nr:coagulation factor IX-like [Cynoglossus semilaevis]